MSKLKDLIRYENANSALAFRTVPYGAEEREPLLVDILALANARISGTRVLVLGVDDELGGERRLDGVDLKAVARLAKSYKQTIREFVQPVLDTSISSLVIDDRTLAVIVLRDCESQPYVLGQDLSADLRAGSSWIRRGSGQVRLEPNDVNNLFKSESATGAEECALQVFFEGPKDALRLKLPALPLSSRPSELARERIEGQLEAKKAAHDRLGATDTWLDRLTFARLHGPDEPYKTQTQVSLLVELGQTDKENEVADKYYEYELRAHLINLVVVNSGNRPLNGASIVVDIPVKDGIAIADRIYPPVGIGAEDIPQGYPRISFGAQRTQIVAKLGCLEPGARVKVFQQPLRLLLREPAIGEHLPVNYTMLGEELNEPFIGSLNVDVTRSDERHINVCVQP